jgi:hypothetical protein
MAGPIRRGRSFRESGQAVTETVLLTWIMLVFVAAALQIFVLNESLFRTMTAGHAHIFQEAFKHNGWRYMGPTWDVCIDASDDQYETNYNVDAWGKAILAYQSFPEIRVQVLGLFRTFGGPEHMDIHSNYPGRPLEPLKGCVNYPCKKLRTAAGAAGPSDESSGLAYWLRPVDIPAVARTYCKAGMTFADNISDTFDSLMECVNSDDFFGCVF